MGIRFLLLKWYRIKGRELPWREYRDPYRIWVSEVILQQTRINQGMAYYFAFLEKFPDVHRLAEADITEVLKVWQGLGYYSRARNMHEAAVTIVKEHGGKFPESYTELIKLKGIGEYTAAAISSIAFGEAVPAIDGNVKRVIARLNGITDDTSRPAVINRIKEILSKEISHNSPGDFNQALMDLGSMICKPVNPLCGECPLSENCYAFRLDQVNEIPVKYKKIKSRKRYFHYLIIISSGEVLLNRRKGKDIWEGLYEFPLFETDHSFNDRELQEEVERMIIPAENDYLIQKISPEIIHILSHQKIITRFIHIEMDEIPDKLKKSYILSKRNDINEYPLPRLIEKYLPEITG